MPRNSFSLNNVPAFFQGNLSTAVALGLIPGWRRYRKFGMNPSCDTGTEDVWAAGGTRAIVATAGTVSVVSDSVADDVGSTGATSITIEGLDSTYTEISETVALDGTTPVVTTASFFRIHRAYIASAGTGRTNAGNITFTLDGGTQAYIEATEGQTHITQYTVPADHTLLVTHVILTTGRQSTSTDLQTQYMIMYGGVSSSNAWRAAKDLFLYNTTLVSSEATLVVPEKSETRWRVIANTNSNQVSAETIGYLINNNFL